MHVFQSYPKLCAQKDLYVLVQKYGLMPKPMLKCVCVCVCMCVIATAVLSGERTLQDCWLWQRRWYSKKHMLCFYHSSTLTKNTHKKNTHTQPRQTKWNDCICTHSLKWEFTCTFTHTHTHSIPHTASFISGALFISGSVSTPQGIYSREYISGEECRMGGMNILLD